MNSSSSDNWLISLPGYLCFRRRMPKTVSMRMNYLKAQIRQHGYYRSAEGYHRMIKLLNMNLALVPYEPGLQPYFEKLNKAWIQE